MMGIPALRPHLTVPAIELLVKFSLFSLREFSAPILATSVTLCTASHTNVGVNEAHEELFASFLKFAEQLSEVLEKDFTIVRPNSSSLSSILEPEKGRALAATANWFSQATKSVKKKAAPLPSPSVVSVPLLPSTLTPTMAPPPSAPSVLPPAVALSPPPVSAPPVPLQRCRGAKATTYIFSDAQLTHLNDLIPQFVAEVKHVNPDLKPHNAALTKWKKVTSKAVMKLDLFKTLITLQKQLKKWEERSNPLENITNIVTTKAPALPSKPVENTLARAMGIFSSQVPTHEIFVFENPELLQAKIDEVKKCQPNLFGGALHNIALSELMASDEVNNDEWEAKALAIKGDIDG
ncbi:hypothetical protein CPB84DRAFT_1756266 [Gymnopilus junonius]|uniref:Uncharacterized protein n=1 Tax=Gymnopilus junonius TaxID=109634 RepID=A0A9P5TED1_GYMJU|nr:hypothetical protein CPB84DRAFT_1756266 [Gymnopilus junonius]